ncbi:MAG: hypothetical protein NTX49_08875 [Chlamydiae bacterium]|nr:hypothetical protein [Chlamydiota bacterium]
MSALTIELNRAPNQTPVSNSGPNQTSTWGSRIVEQLTPSRDTYMKWANVAAHIAVIFAEVAVYLALIAPLIIGIVAATHLNPLLLCLAATVPGTSSIVVAQLNKAIFDDIHRSINQNIK